MNNYFWVGVVEDRMDPLYLGRCRVRIFGTHTQDIADLPTDDLPWAVSVTPATSASMNGVGTAPVGPVEGTTVVGFFLDYPETQMPAFIGSITGIPQQENEPNDPNDIQIENNKLDEEPGYANPRDPENFEPEESGFDALSPHQLKCSEWGVDRIKRLIPLYLDAHWDGKQWVLAYSQAVINTRQVVQHQFVTAAEAETLLRSRIAKEIEPTVRKKIKVDVTQSMFDTFCILEIQGADKCFKAYEVINQRRYDDVREVLNKEGYSDLARLFVRDGMPRADGSTSLSKSKSTWTTKSPTTIIRGRNPQPKEVFYNFGSAPTEWPRKLHLNEPDTNRLARHHNIRRTVVYQKEQELEEGITLANMELSWKHSDVPYNARYPYNHVIETESGHIIEVDDTPGCERINIHHEAGSFIEIDANGTRVSRTKGDVYEIMERNGFVHVKGHVVVNVEGGANINVDGNADLHVGNNLYASVDNDAKLMVKGGMDMVIDKQFQLVAESINIGATGGDINFVFPQGNFQADGRQVWLNSGKSTGPETVSIEDHRTDFEAVEAALAPMQVLTRVAEELTLVELPDEDSVAEKHRSDMVKNGVETPTAFVDPPYKKEEEASPGTNQTLVVEPILEKTKNTPTYQLSKYFTLGDLTQSTTIPNSRRDKPVKAAHGLSEKQIITNLSKLATNCMDPVYEAFKFDISSGLRWPSTRYSLKGKSISRHEIGLAVDMNFPGKTKKEVIAICKWMTENIPYDLIMLEYSAQTKNYWIHLQLHDGPLRKRSWTAIQRLAKTEIVSYNSFIVVSI